MLKLNTLKYSSILKISHLKTYHVKVKLNPYANVIVKNEKFKNIPC